MRTTVEHVVLEPVVRTNRGVTRQALLAAKRFLQSPQMIVGELLAIAIAGIIGACLPQQGSATSAQLAQLQALGPMAASLVNLFALDHVFRSTWFLTLILLASASLSIVLAGQLRRLRAIWTLQPTEAQFLQAPFRAEFERPARFTSGRTVDIRTFGRLGIAGSATIHLALLLIIVAGGLRALFAVDAAVDLIEGETLHPTANAWAAQWPGVLARKFHLDVPITLNEVHALRYDVGELQDLRVQVTLQQENGPRKEQIAINRELDAPGGRLYLAADFGPAALIDLHEGGKSRKGQSIFLKNQGKGRFEGSGPGPDSTIVHLRAEVDRAGNRPSEVEVRVVGAQGSPLIYTGILQVGEALSLPGGNTLALHGLPFWARVRGSHDPALWLAYTGFALALVGLAIIFTIVKIDTCVVVTPNGDREQVFVALQAHRHASLFKERFLKLVHAEGGQA